MRRAYEAWLLVLAIVVAAIALACLVGAYMVTPEQQHVDTSQFVRRGELGMGVRALNEAANAAITARLAEHGLTARSVRIVSEKVDGDRGTVVAQVSYGPVVAYVTVILHRTAWQLGQLTVGAPPEDVN